LGTHWLCHPRRRVAAAWFRHRLLVDVHHLKSASTQAHTIRNTVSNHYLHQDSGQWKEGGITEDAETVALQGLEEVLWLRRTIRHHSALPRQMWGRSCLCVDLGQLKQLRFDNEAIRQNSEKRQHSTETGA
jgi:hypothetical protein